MAYEFVVISMDTECGRRRRAKIDFPYRRVIGVRGDAAPAEFRDRFTFMYNTSPARASACVGCTYSHRLALQLIIDLNLRDVVVLEDDAMLVRPLPNLATMPRDCAVFFGGALRTPGAWARQSKEFSRENEEAVWLSLREGLNDIRWDEFTVSGTEAVFIPDATVAQRLADALDTERLIWIDMFYRKHRLIPKLYFPNPFAALDAQETENEGNGAPRLRDLYAEGLQRIRKRREILLSVE